MIKLYHTLDEIYQQGAIVSFSNKPQCSVCKKEFASTKNVDKHMAKRNCYKLSDVFYNTVFEKKMYDLFLSLQHNNRKYNSLKTFRSLPLYNTIARLFDFCIKHKVSDITLYANFCLGKYHVLGNKIALEKGHKIEALDAFRQHLRLYPEYINSADFIERHRARLNTDLTFVGDSLRRADIDLTSLLEAVNIDTLLQHSTPVEQAIFSNLMDKLDAERSLFKLV